MWERFSYYGMRAFLILYMTAPVAAGGLGFDVPRASSVYGTYTGSVWVTPILGGLVADRMLGAYRSVLLGGIVIALGHFTLALRALPRRLRGRRLGQAGARCWASLQSNGAASPLWSCSSCSPRCSGLPTSRRRPP